LAVGPGPGRESAWVVAVRLGASRHGTTAGRRVSQTAWMIYGPQGRWIEHLDDGPWRVEEILAPFGGWQGTYLNWREGCWPADVERYLLDASRRDRMPLLGCYVQVSDFGYVVGLVAGEVVARYVVNPRRTQVWIEGGWALEQCAAHHGPDWQRTGLDALARWSQVAPRPLAVEQLAPLLAAEHLFPEHPLFGDLPDALGILPPPEPLPWEGLPQR
jgi:hypothetical protein